MKNSPYMKIRKWENQLNRFCFYAYNCAMKGIICKYNKKRYQKISKNIDFLDKKLNKISQRK